MLKYKIEKYIEMLECECEDFSQQSAEKRFVAAILASYIDDLKEILTKEQTQ